MRKTILGLSVFAFILSLGGIFATGALAYRGDPAVKGPNYSAERHQAMLKAFEARDYEAWKELMGGRSRVSELITETTFAKLAEARQLALQGKYAEAEKIRLELGLHRGR